MTYKNTNKKRQQIPLVDDGLSLKFQIHINFKLGIQIAVVIVAVAEYKQFKKKKS